MDLMICSRSLRIRFRLEMEIVGGAARSSSEDQLSGGIVSDVRGADTIGPWVTRERLFELAQR
jgi:hypothetical protein